MVRSNINSAILLAAGLGTRLRPLTNKVPKALLPLGHELLIDHQLKYLAKNGIEEVVINLHHLGEMIRKHCGRGERYGLHIFYSEEPKILGTGGGIKKAAMVLGVKTCVVLNCDAVLDVDVRALVAHHTKNGTDSTMVLVKKKTSDEFTPISVDESGHLSEFGKGNYVYTGLQIIGPKLLRALPPAGDESCLINDGYKKIISSGVHVGTYIHKGYWNDLGTFPRYETEKKRSK